MTTVFRAPTLAEALAAASAYTDHRTVAGDLVVDVSIDITRDPETGEHVATCTSGSGLGALDAI